MKKFLIDAAKFAAGVVIGLLIAGGLTGYGFATAIQRGDVTVECEKGEVVVLGEKVDATGSAIQADSK
jgi:hypothetical protein